MLIKHTAPILEGEDILCPPGFEDPRTKPFQDNLILHGLMDENGIMLANVTIQRGVGPHGFIWQAFLTDEVTGCIPKVRK